ncbi:hypothetical protein [Amorphus sp. 3PC139-8]|uniref:hypothetical protein n=1 Tax=Amorphus sp. 3PC139-8 TaxID=2735676 RepID=UPI00345D3831
MIRHLVFGVLMLAPAAALSGEPDEADNPGGDSVYSRLDFQACPVLDATPAGEPGSWVHLRCPGLSGYQVHVSEEDDRVTLD